MPDIFISYSRKNSEQATELADRLRRENLQVWIDQHGIVGAEQWGAEIVEGIQSCPTFLLLLSPDSIQSDHVLKELALASEKSKRIVPVELVPTDLPRAFQYPLAGLQRVSFQDFEKILQAHRIGMERRVAADSRKSLMVLPFEDQSPEQNNQWFANGIGTELITSLSGIRTLRIVDERSSLEFKGFKGRMSEIAREMSVRYFVEGSVRKFGDQIKITARLLDMETGDYLWQDSIKAMMADIFDVQEAVATKVVEGLKLHLTSDEKKKLVERGTDNAEAYELYLRAGEYFRRQTKDGHLAALGMARDAFALDPNFAMAYSFRANILALFYSHFDRDPAHLREAEALAIEALRIKPDLAYPYHPLSQVYAIGGRLEEAETAAREFIRRDPTNPISHFSLGFFYTNTRQFAKAIAPYEEAVRLQPDFVSGLWNLITACHQAHDLDRSREWAVAALPIFDRHVRLHPDDEVKVVQRGAIYFFAGKEEEAKAFTSAMISMRDGLALYNAANLSAKLGDKAQAMHLFEKAITGGYRHVRQLRGFLESELTSFRGTPEYEAMVRMVEKIEQEVNSNI